nr:hypothetical protein BaRGS_015464 [Batillaria attramentaria]
MAQNQKVAMVTGGNRGYQQLDLGDSASIRRFVDFIKRTHGGIDVVIANGAMPFPKQMTVAEIEATLEVVHLGPELRKRFLATDTMTVAELNGLLDEYMAAVKDGSFKEKGWPDWCNKVPINNDNVESIMTAASMLQLDTLVRFCEEHMIADELNVDKEETVYEAVVMWVKYDIENRHKTFTKLFQLCTDRLIYCI